MSILRQLMLSITIAIVAILLGTLIVTVSGARDYLSGQLQVQSNDAAVSLALSLSQPSNNDPVIQELLVSALYDGGTFAVVRLTDTEGRIVIERVSDQARAPSVPAWFKSIAPLDHGEAKHAVSDGWRQIGEVTLVANDAYAWETLWQSCVRLILLVLASGMVWAIFAYGLVRWIKRRLLAGVSEQVKSIDRGEPVVQPAFAHISEFAGVADALSQTRQRLRVTAEEQKGKIESLEIELNQDPVTGLANRKYFINEFRRELDQGMAAHSPDVPARLGTAGGHVLVFRQRDLAAINRHMPRDFTDQWLHSVSQRVQDTLSQFSDTPFVLARLNGSDFGLLLPHCAAPQAMMIGERLRTELRALRLPVGEGHLCRWAQALVDYTPAAKIGDVLSRLDFGLMQAESAGDDRVVLVDNEQQGASPTTQSAWKDAIMTAIEGNRFSLALFPLTSQTGELVRMESMLQLHNVDTQEPIPAPLFIPPAVRLNLSADCDLQAIRLGLEWLTAHQGDISVMLSLPSLSHPQFLERLKIVLSEYPSEAGRLFIEIDAHGLVERPADVQAFAKAATQFGARLGVRRLAQQFGALSHLHDLPLSYVKLGGGFVSGMRLSPGSQQLTASVVETARKLGIDVYAEDVPDNETREILADLGITLMRGPGITR